MMCYNQKIAMVFPFAKGDFSMNKKIAAIVSILLVFSFLFAFAGCDSTEEEPTTETTITAKTPLPTDITTSYDEESQLVTDTTYSAEVLQANTKTIFEYFNIHINELKSADVKASLNVSVDKNISKAKDAEGNDIAMSENEYVATAINSLSDYMLNEEGSSAEYGPVKDLLPVQGQAYVSALTLEEVESATCVDNGKVRTITVILKSPAPLTTVEKAYDIGSVQDVLAEFEKAEEYMTVTKEPVLTYKDCVIIINVDVETDEVFSIEYKKNIDVETEVTGQGTLASVGATPVNFRYESYVKYELDRTNPAETAAAE